MNWLLQLSESNATAFAFVIISFVCMGGMMLGSLRIRGIGLGTAGVLFVGVVVGNFSKPIDHATLEFLKELGLVLFVFCIGLQLGPRFISSMREMGLQLNLLAATIVISGALLVTAWGFLLDLDFASVLGMFSGATTNTPSLAAAQQTLSQIPGVDAKRQALPALAYAVTYPMAIVGIIGSMLFLRWVMQISPAEEAAKFAANQRKGIEPLERRTLRIQNPNLDGLKISEVPSRLETGVVISRIQRGGESGVETAHDESVLHVRDLVLAVGTKGSLDQYQRVVGTPSDVDLMESPGQVQYRRVVVTNSDALGKTVRQLGLEQLFGVTVTRVTRGDVEVTAVPNLHLQFGDVLQVVGEEEGIKQASLKLGNSLKALNETHFVPLFAGIAAGIALGTYPVDVPGLPQPLRLGLAGGPLLIAILVGRLGRIGKMVIHMPLNANLAFREFGIALFFASVGLMAGPQFFDVVFSTRGLVWLIAGFFVTIIPILSVGYFALKKLKLNYVVVSGLLAGSMTDPPALTFASDICQSDTPAVTYAAVYPLTMVLRILAAQVLAVALCS